MSGLTHGCPQVMVRMVHRACAGPQLQGLVVVQHCSYSSRPYTRHTYLKGHCDNACAAQAWPGRRQQDPVLRMPPVGRQAEASLIRRAP
jgi:hypothetical protein